MIAAALALSAILARIFVPADGVRVPDSNGFCCVEPTPYFIARTIGDLAPVIVAACALWMLVIWLRSRRSR